MIKIKELTVFLLIFVALSLAAFDVYLIGQIAGVFPDQHANLLENIHTNIR